VDYTPYLLAIEILGLVWLVAVWFVRAKDGKRGGLMNMGGARNDKLADKKRSKSKSRRLSHRNVSLEQQAMRIPTPWGWPHYKHNNYGASEMPSISTAVRSFSDALMREKQEVAAPSSDPRISGSLRALLEDRYARVNKNPINEIPYEPVKLPSSRDPSVPFDQMENFGTREAESIRNRIDQSAEPDDRQSAAKTSFLKHPVDVKKLKVPWGW